MPRRLLVYVAWEFLLALAQCLLIFLTLLLLAAIFDDLSDFLRHHASSLEIVHYFALLQPLHFVQILPIALLLATMWAITGLARHNEITAIRAAGISIFQCTTPLWLIAAIGAAMQFATAEYLAPRCLDDAQQLMRAVTDPDGTHRRNETAYLAYRNGIDRRDWLFKSFAADGVSFGVVMTQFRDDGTVEWELQATGAAYINNEWNFFNAVRRRFNRTGETMITAPEQHETLIMPELAEKPESVGFLYNLRLVEEISLQRIMTLLQHPDVDLPDSTQAILRTYLYRRIFSPFSCLVAVLLGIPLALTHERSAAMRGFVTVIIVMAFFFLISELFVVLGKNQTVPPLLAGALPVAAFTAWGILVLLRRH